MQQFINSRIDGEFKGWDGDSIYKLEDGSKWKLASYLYTYNYSTRPNATVWKDGSRYFLTVDSMTERVEITKVN